MTTVKYDVIIIGAGPAGTSAATTLGKKGEKVLLLEGKTFPREKPCGGFISKKTLDLLGIPIHPFLIENVIHSLRLYSPRYDWINTNNRDMLGITVLRSSFQYLVEEAKASGVVIKTGERVYHIMQSDEKVEVATEKGRYEGRYAIGADGVISSIARILGLQPCFLI
ncbi:MAG: NAD(P)/FAD-dependent oxidoreductase [Clostridia bacterium]|jgi:flavin-dependent dehydrogenase